ncbi:UNKNOWN [Stylonychia lemnae]|uniref:Transmembrane protein n=1 Tax=Stylonychia lemnae TaxID=5949 RepID=A0A078A3K5_STYLE|nr:UNKNOWN [Stylonychia lemnae]|eukprot:CDW76108.1 UNKNOWN [Stylonychia lemnae]
MLPQYRDQAQNQSSSDSNTLGQQQQANNNYKLTKKYIKHYIFKMVRPKQMDFDLALFLMINSLKSPAKLYQYTKRLKQIRNQWHRDDPCLVSSIIVILFIIGITYGIVLQKDFVTGYLQIAMKMILLHFALSGVIISFGCKFIAERYMRKEDKQSVHAAINSIEPMYAFDIHCNSFFPFFVFAYLFQLLLLPLTNREGIIPLICSNTLHFIAAAYYWFLTFRGYAVQAIINNFKMSFYNDPRYFQKFSQELKSTVRQNTGYKGGEELKLAFDYFRDQTNIATLESMRLNNKDSIDSQNVKLKVDEVVNGFRAFGFSDEAIQLNAFLKGVGEFVKNNKGQEECVFTPFQMLQYQQIIQKKNYMQDQEFIKIFFKSISSDGRVVTIEDMRRMLRELRQDETKAEEYVERTAGLSKAKQFSLDQITEVIRGKMVPQSYTQKKQKELEIQKQIASLNQIYYRQKELIQKQEEMEKQQQVELIGQRKVKKSEGSRSRKSRSKKRRQQQDDQDFNEEGDNFEVQDDLQDSSRKPNDLRQRRNLA